MIFYLSYRARRLSLLDRFLVIPAIGFSLGSAVHSGWTHDWAGIVLELLAAFLCWRIHGFLKTTIQRLENAPYE